MYSNVFFLFSFLFSQSIIPYFLIFLIPLLPQAPEHLLPCFISHFPNIRFSLPLFPFYSNFTFHQLFSPNLTFSQSTCIPHSLITRFTFTISISLVSPFPFSQFNQSCLLPLFRISISPNVSSSQFHLFPTSIFYNFFCTFSQQSFLFFSFYLDFSFFSFTFFSIWLFPNFPNLSYYFLNIF